MKTIRFTPILTLAAALMLGACATSSPPPGYAYRDGYRDAREYSRSGEVVDIDRVARRARTSGGGAVLGAILGAAIGNQIGSGRGRAAATGAGAVGGAVIGNELEKRRLEDADLYRVVVALDDGRSREFHYEYIGDLRVGDRVSISDGELWRL